MLLAKFKEWAFNNLTDFVKAEGELVSKEQADARIEICNHCSYKGIVRPLPVMEVPGCTICGCPMATKPWMKTMLRKIENLGEPLSITEIIELKTIGKFNRDEFIEEDIVCPHPDGNKWEAIDSKFL